MIILFLSFIAIACAVLILLPSTKRIEGEIIGYTRCEQAQNKPSLLSTDTFIHYDAYKYYNMPQSVIDDIKKNPKKYAEHGIEIDIRNVSIHTLHSLEAVLSKECGNIWVSSVLSKGQLNLEPQEAFGTFVSAVVKTDGLTETEIDALIKGIGLTIKSYNFGVLESYKKIYFKN